MGSKDRRPKDSFSGGGVRGEVDRLFVVLGDQLDIQSQALAATDKRRDAVLMMEVAGESTHIPVHKQRIVVFLAAMRHFAKDLACKGYRLRYVRLDDANNTQSLGGELERAVRQLKPRLIVCTWPGGWRVKKVMEETARAAGVALETQPDRHFLVNQADFDTWMAGRKQPVMEHFYREQRRRLGVLVGKNGQPEGGAWNFDKDNRESFNDRPRADKPYTPRPDALTKGVIGLVRERFAGSPGSLESFRWPVTRRQALRALDDFVTNRLADFGTWQDAMWTEQPFLYHSLLSASLNLKLLDPRECVERAVAAYEQGKVPLNSAEGFIRQIIGWREFIRGVYWHEGEAYGDRNALAQHGTLPEFYWTGQTEMVCMQQSIGQVLRFGYGHHIQRLMVTGNFALVAGVDPRVISDWYLGMYVDAVDWVTLPNTLGMVMHADGGVVGTKPYAASGKYIDRMSNYCRSCSYRPGERIGDEACPFTTFYWDFLIRHRKRFQHHQRMKMMLRNLDRLGSREHSAISDQAGRRRGEFGIRGVN